MIVELIGPPGVGKSTLRNLLIAEYPKLKADETSFSGFKSFLKPDQRREIVERFVSEDCSALTDFCLNNINDAILSSYQKLSALSFLLEGLKSAALATYYSNLNPNAIIVLDEGVIHKSFALMVSEEDCSKYLFDFFHYAPKPEVIVNCFADPKEVFKRLTERSKVVSSLMGRSKLSCLNILQNSTSSYGNLSKVISEDGVKVINANLNVSVENVALDIYRLLSSKESNV